MSEQAIRIAFVMHVMQVAGAEMLVAETIQRLGSKIDPVVLCLDGVGELGRELQSAKVPVLDLNRRPGLDLKVAHKLAKECSKRGIEIVHAHQYTPFFYSAIAKLVFRGNFRLIFTEHGRHYPDIVSRKRRWANRLVFNGCADEINAVCRFSADSLSQKDGFPYSRVKVVENGIDPGRYGAPTDKTELCKTLGLDPMRKYILCVARFHHVKDHETLLKAFAVVAAEKGDVDLLLAGDGPLRSNLEKLSIELGLGPRVRFLGVRNDVPALMGAASIFALTSVSEAASLTLMEAMASGLPVVVTDVGGNAEIVRNETDGILAPRGDAAAIARALVRLLSEPSTGAAFGRSGRSRVLEKYPLDRTIMNHYQRYTSLAGRN